MTWQDELQHLDAELAAGRISAEEYRNRRDAALGRAKAEAESGPSSGGFPAQQPESGPSSGGFPAQQPETGPPSGGFPQQQESGPSSGGFPAQDSGGFPQQEAPQQQGSPFPPAFNWGTAAQQQPQQPGSNDATQVVQNPLLQQQPAQQSDNESTQVVNLNQTPPQQPWPGQQQQQAQWPQQQGWNNPEPPSTPWGDGDVPATEHGDTSWMRQGPEVFDSAGKSGKGKMIAGVSIGAVLLVGVIVAGVFYFTSQGGEQPSPQNPPTAQPQTPPTSSLPEPPAAKAPPASSQEVLVALPGAPNPWNGPLDPASLGGGKSGLLQPQAVRDFALQNGFVDGWFTGSAEGTTPKTTLLALRMPDQNSASGVVEKYLGAQQGLSSVDDLSFQGVDVVNTGGTFRTAYVVHNWVVIVDVSAGNDKPAARELFKSTLDQQLQQSPPTVRK
ncbi:hypothetical protein [Saccharopolyspora taberi]|uniref:DUF1707 domain-containing protein n=1 Tax=Saccharopolyspora taberi TaxID=60895 RepID=A0ABN3VMZ4_9PSEU